MSSVSCTSDHQELIRTRRQVITRLSRAPRSFHMALMELDFNNPLGPGLSMIIEYMVYTDRYYYNMCSSTSRHAIRKAQRRRRMIIKAVIKLRSENMILTEDRQVVHPQALQHESDKCRTKKRKKNDHRPYHGRPGRDRRRLPQFATT